MSLETCALSQVLGKTPQELDKSLQMYYLGEPYFQATKVRIKPWSDNVRYINEKRN